MTSLYGDPPSDPALELSDEARAILREADAIAHDASMTTEEQVKLLRALVRKVGTVQLPVCVVVAHAQGIAVITHGLWSAHPTVCHAAQCWVSTPPPHCDDGQP